MWWFPDEVERLGALAERVSRRSSAADTGALPSGGAPVDRHGDADVGQRRAELPAGADAELGEHLAQVPLDRARAEEQLGADLRVREPVGRQPRDLRLLRRQLVERLDGALAHRLAGGQQLAAGALGERLHAHLGEHLVRGAQLLAGVDAAVLAAQPLAVEQVRAGERHADAGAAEPLDRLAVERARRPRPR